MRNERHYHVILSDEEAERLRQTAKTERDRMRGLAAEIRRGCTSDGAITLAKMLESEAEGWERVFYISGADDSLEMATRALSRWYNERVSSLAEDVLAEILRGEVSDLHDHLHETCDSTDLVIYTHKAKCVLLASDNEDAYQEEMGEPAPSVEAAAFMALEADVRNELERLANNPPEGVTLPEGFELHDSSTWQGTPDVDGDAADETADEDEDEGTADGDASVAGLLELAKMTDDEVRELLVGREEGDTIRAAVEAELMRRGFDGTGGTIIPDVLDSERGYDADAGEVRP